MAVSQSISVKKKRRIDFVGDCAEKIVSGDDERQTVVFHENAIIRYDFEKTIFYAIRTIGGKTNENDTYHRKRKSQDPS